MKYYKNIYRCSRCGLEFPEEELGSITEDGKDICPACGRAGCCEEMEGDYDD